MFGPGRARREQPICCLGFGVRAFVRSVSHANVLVARLFWLLRGVCVPHCHCPWVSVWTGACYWHGDNGELLARASAVLKSQGRRKLVPWETRSLRGTLHSCAHSQGISKKKKKRRKTWIRGLLWGTAGVFLPCRVSGNQRLELCLVVVSFWSGRKGNPAAAAYVPMQQVVSEIPSRS